MAWVPPKELVDNADYDTHITSHDHFAMARYFRLADWLIGGFGAVSSTLFGSSLILQLLVSKGILTDVGKILFSLSFVGPWLACSFVAYALAKYLDFRGLSTEHHRSGAAFNTIHRRAQRLYEYMNTTNTDTTAIANEWRDLNNARDEVEKKNSLPTWGYVHNRSKQQVQKERQARKKNM